MTMSVYAPPTDRDSSALSSAIVFFPGLSSEGSVDVLANTAEFTITRLADQILISASPSAPIFFFRDVLRSVTYSTTQTLE